MSIIYDRDGNVYETGISGTTNSENKLIIEQLNKFGRVPQTFELLQMIKQLEQETKQLKNNWNKLKQKIIDSFNKTQDVRFIKVLQEIEKIEQWIVS